jgi:hypothetical protein
MATWRRRALELFPQWRRELNDPEFSIYMLYFELLSLARDAHKEADEPELLKIYGFAKWCFEQKNGELRNATGVAFYEHLFDNWSLRHDVAKWITPEILRNCWCLWEARLESAQIVELREVFAERDRIRTRKRPH